MIIEITKKYPHTPFAVHIDQVENDPGTWNSNKVSIYRDGNLIGEYLRNYNNYGANTFYPFEINHEWYALYSANYTATRVMKLHHDHIEDWCGEDPNSLGFCPVEFYVPRYVETKHKLMDLEYTEYTIDCDSTPEEFELALHENGFIGVNSCNFGFMCGCVWGDDTSWKLRHIDLSLIPGKILTVTDKFGYWELPDSLELKECINMSGWEPDHEWVRLYRAESINLKTNERC
jgi:hypothetical protein